MNRKEIITRIGKLQDKHPISSEVCPGCEICNEVGELGKLLKYSPKTQAILDKGEDMTTLEIRYLLEREVPHADIATALNISEKDMNELIAVIKTPKIKEEDILKKEEYKQLKEFGSTESEVVKKLGFKNKYELTKWKKENFTQDELVRLNNMAEIARAENKAKAKDVEEKGDIGITHVKYDSKRNEKELIEQINELKKKIAENSYMELAIEDYKEKLELEKQKKERMIQAHRVELEEVETDKAHVQKQHLDTLEKLKETDYELENKKQELLELTSKHNQLLLRIESYKRELKPTRELLAVYVGELVNYG